VQTDYVAIQSDQVSVESDTSGISSAAKTLRQGNGEHLLQLEVGR
jgi:hypothetical protein